MDRNKSLYEETIKSIKTTSDCEEVREVKDGNWTGKFCIKNGFEIYLDDLNLRFK